MKTIKVLLLVLSICSLSLGCKKDSMPKPTQTGANNMYAKVNGQPWKPKGCIGGCSEAFGVSYDNRINFGVSGRNSDQNIGITIVLRNLKAIGTYELSSTNLDFGALDNSDSNFITTLNNKGTVTITKLDLDNKIISGTFEFTAEDKDNPENTIRVTDGWFDGKYRF